MRTAARAINPERRRGVPRRCSPEITRSALARHTAEWSLQSAARTPTPARDPGSTTPIRSRGYHLVIKPGSDGSTRVGANRASRRQDEGSDGERARDRTWDRRIKSPLLYQLSYAPTGRPL